LLHVIKSLGGHARGFFAEIVTTATSKGKLKQLLGISLYRNAFYLIITHLAVPLAGFVFWIIAARFYAAEDVGLASATISAMLLLTALSTLGLDFGLVRFLPHSGQSANRMLNSSLTITGLASIILCGIFLAGTSIWSPALLFLRQNPLYLAAFVVFTGAMTLSIIVGSVFVAQRRAGFTLARALIACMLRLPLPILLAAFFHSFGIFASWGISVAVSLVIGVLFFLPRVQPGYRLFPAISRNTVTEVMRFSLANYIANLFWLLPGYILPLMVLNMLGAEPNAYFYIAWSVGNVMTVVPLAISTSLFAEGSYDEQRLVTNTWRSLKLTFLIVVPAVIVIAIIADKLLLLFGSAYSESGTMLLRIAVLSTFPIAVNYIYMSLKRVQKKLAVLIELSVFIAVATLGLSYLFLPWIGINGVGLAWLGSQGGLGSQGVVAGGIIISFLLKRAVVREGLRRFKTSLWRRR